MKFKQKELNSKIFSLKERKFWQESDLKEWTQWIKNGCARILRVAWTAGIQSINHFSSHALRPHCQTEREPRSVQQPIDHSWTFGSTDWNVQDRRSDNVCCSADRGESCGERMCMVRLLMWVLPFYQECRLIGPHSCTVMWTALSWSVSRNYDQGSFFSYWRVRVAWRRHQDWGTYEVASVWRHRWLSQRWGALMRCLWYVDDGLLFGTRSDPIYSRLR